MKTITIDGIEYQLTPVPYAAYKLEQEINEQEQIDALKAQVNCLREALLNTIMYRVGTVNYGDPLKALESTPEQCLAKVRAKAIEEYKKEQAEMKRMEFATKLMVSSI